jgi:hypothetical protein
MGDIQAWVRQSVLLRQKVPEAKPPLVPPYRPDMMPDQAAPYLFRALNEWLPAEVARLLTAEGELGGSDEGGMPVLAVAKVLERMLLLEHFSPNSLELFLEAGRFSPKYFYPADIEILRDVVLRLLGRTAAPDPHILPAIVVAGKFAEAAGQAFLVSSEGAEELHIPIDEAQALELLKHDPVRIGSIVVTMDGRCWQSSRLQRGQETVIVYHPGKRLRIDFTSEHARLLVPWPDAETSWQGEIHLPDHVALFGREWSGRTWERRADQTQLHLEFSRVLTFPESLENTPRRLRPASIEMAWSEVEQVLATGASDSIDQLRREDLLPLARALERLVNGLVSPWWATPEDLQQSLMSVHYLHGSIAAEYGRIPWRVLPAPARKAFLKRSGDDAFTQILGETFDGTLTAVPRSPSLAV